MWPTIKTNEIFKQIVYVWKQSLVVSGKKTITHIYGATDVNNTLIWEVLFLVFLGVWFFAINNPIDLHLQRETWLIFSDQNNYFYLVQ